MPLYVAAEPRDPRRLKQSSTGFAAADHGRVKRRIVFRRRPAIASLPPLSGAWPKRARHGTLQARTAVRTST